MSTTLETNTAASAVVSQNATATAANRIRQNFAACRVHFNWFGTNKTLSPEQKSQAAESFGADGAAISAGKKLIDTRHNRLGACCLSGNRISNQLRSTSLAQGVISG